MKFPFQASRPIFVVSLMGDMGVGEEGPVIPGTGACVTHYRASIADAPTGAAVIVDLYLGDRTTGARAGAPFKSISIAAGTYKLDGALDEGIRLAATDFVQAVCSQKGSTLPGTDFVCELFGGGGGGPLPGTALNVTTKGDVQGFSTVPARIPVGANGDVLTADSSEALGVKWAPPSASPSLVGALVFSTVDLPIPSTVYTELEFDAVAYDTAGMVDPLFPERITIQEDGYYLVGAAYYYESALAGNIVGRIKLNAGAPITQDFRYNAGAGSGGNYFSVPYYLEVGDILTVESFQDSGSPVDIEAATGGGSPAFWAVKIGA